MKLNTTQKINMLAIEILEQFGLYAPSQRQIDLVETQLHNIKQNKAIQDKNFTGSFIATLTAH